MSILAITAGGGSGSAPDPATVLGPVSATDNAATRYDGTTGKLLQNSGVLIDDSNNVTVPDSAALKLSNVVGAPQIKRSSTNLIVEANDGSGYANITIQTGRLVANDTTGPSVFKDVQIANTNSIAFSDGSDFAQGLMPCVGTGVSGVRVIGSSSSTAGGVGGGRIVAAKTSNYTVLITESRNSYTNDGASGSVTFSLPAATIINSVGIEYQFAVLAAQNLVIDAAGTDLIYVGSTATSAGGTVTSNTVGSSLIVTLVKTGVWVAIASGVWVTA